MALDRPSRPSRLVCQRRVGPASRSPQRKGRRQLQSPQRRKPSIRRPRMRLTGRRITAIPRPPPKRMPSALTPQNRRSNAKALNRCRRGRCPNKVITQLADGLLRTGPRRRKKRCIPKARQPARQRPRKLRTLGRAAAIRTRNPSIAAGLGLAGPGSCCARVAVDPGILHPREHSKWKC
jgi:hypothetical protein